MMNYKLLELKHRLKEILITCKYYNSSPAKNKQNTRYICMIDGLFLQGGLSDRFKGMISLYAFCKQRNINFGIFFKDPFLLTDYLLPNKYDWVVNENTLKYNIYETRVFYNFVEYKGSRLLKLSTNKQLHYYGNRDLLEILNKTGNTNYLWGELFLELFKPTPAFEEQIIFHLNKLGNHFYSAVFRFQQLLGDFREYDFPVLNKIEKEILINRCTVALCDLKMKLNGVNILVTSDSVTFLEHISTIEGIYTIPGKVVHIDVSKGETYNVYLKSFLDFFVLSNSIKVFSIGTNQMYASEFPMYAAKVNNVPYERLNI